MKCRISYLAMIGLLLCPVALKAQTLSGDDEKKARDLLQNVIDSRERNRTPPPIIVAPAPLVQNPAPLATSAAPAAVIIPPPVMARPAPLVIKSTPESEKLTPTGLRPNRPPSYAELEQQYLSGKITARQFQQYLQDQKLAPTPVSPPPSNQLRPVGTPPQVASANSASNTAITGHKPAEVAPFAPSPASVEPKPETQSPADQSTLSEVEKKMDELLRLKAARDQAAADAALTKTNSVDSSKPKTRRERMDDLLKLYVAGKVSETEYKARREQLISEPEPK